jgi:uncharacterized protein YeaO (DUF488 family)
MHLLLNQWANARSNKVKSKCYCEERPKGGIPEDEAALKACIESISPSATTRRWIIHQKQDSEREQAVWNVSFALVFLDYR